MEVIEFFLNPQNEEDFEVINTERGKTKTKLPFFDGEIDYRTTLIRVLEITSHGTTEFNPQRFSPAEQDWLVQAGFLNQEKTQFNPTAILLKKIGQALYQSLFPTGGKSEYLLKAALQRANGDELHIRFGFEAESVETNRAADYPWELVHDGTRFLAWHKVSFSRYIAYDDSPPNLPQVDKVNVLLVSSEAFDPDQGLKKLGRSEREAIKEGLQLACQEGHIHLTDLAEEIGNIPTFHALQKYLTEHRGEKQPHVLHFDGHGLYGKKCHQCGKIHTGITPNKCRNETCGETLPPAQGYLVFEDEKGQPDYISVQKLGATLQNFTPSYKNTNYGSLVVVVLSACQSGMAVAGDSVFNGTAQQLIHQSIPAVVAMQYSVTLRAAKKFAEQFYRAIGQKDSLSAAVRQARMAMDIEKNQWYRPVLYLRWHDNEGGQLFKQPGELQNYVSPVPKKQIVSANIKPEHNKMHLRDLIRNGILNQLAVSFNDETMADLLLNTIDFPGHMRPIFPTKGKTLGYWQGICQQIQNGVVPSGNDLQSLVDAAADIFPANSVFQKYRSNLSDFNNSNIQSSKDSQQINFSVENNYENIADNSNSQKKRALQVFLCHSSGDKPTVRKLYQQLKNDGFQPWLDEENLLPGQDWELEIEKAVESADIILVCLSQSSVTKVGYVQKEIKFALDIADRQPEGSIFIIPVKLQSCQIPRRLSNKQWVDLYPDSVKGYSRLVSGLEHKAKELGFNQ